MKPTLIEYQLLKTCLKYRKSDDDRVLRWAEKYSSIFGRSHGRKTASFVKAVKGCIAKGFLIRKENWQWDDYVFSPEGETAARGPEPTWNPSLLKLTERDWEVFGCVNVDWQTTMYVGGWNGSYHSASLAKLCAHGLVETRSGRTYPMKPSIFGRAKGSGMYRLTRKGKTVQKKRKLARLSANASKAD